MGQKCWSVLKKYQYLLLLILCGFAYFSVEQKWDLYLEPIQSLGDRISELSGWDFPELFPGEEWENPQEAEAGEEWSPEVGEETPDEEAEKQPGEDPGETDPLQPVEPEEENPPTIGAVEEEYFRDALFIGDSRTVGMRDYGKFPEETTFYASEGLTIFKLFTAEIVEVEGQKKKITVEEALQEREFGKIYLMVGINELGTGDVERFEKAYREAVERIRELQPQAVIYIQSIIKVTVKRSQKGDYVTNQGIIDRNEAVQQLADNRTIFYLDVNEAVCDESGGMNPEFTTDGVHLMAKYLYLWKDYLKEHAVLL